MANIYVRANLSEAVIRATSDISRYDDRVQKKIRDAIRDGVDDTWREALNRAPMGKTGNLKQGIEKEHHGTYGVVKSTAPHSHLVEFGTDIRIVAPKYRKALKINGGFVRGDIYSGKMPKAPFMRPAIEQTRPEIEREVEEAIDNAADS